MSEYSRKCAYQYVADLIGREGPFVDPELRDEVERIRQALELAAAQPLTNLLQLEADDGGFGDSSTPTLK